MQLHELKEILSQTGLPVAVRVFEEPQALPFIVILPTGGWSDGSDSGNEIIARSYQIELYAVDKDEASEEKLELLLDRYGLKWEKDETYISDEAVYMAAYGITFLEKRK